MPGIYKTHHLSHERTLLLIKPDGVMRGLIGEVLKRLEQRGLKITGLKMVQATAEQVDNFYPKDPAWIERLGNKGLKTFAEYELDPVEYLGTSDPTEIGKVVRAGFSQYMTMSPIVAVVVEGIHAVSVVRKLIGPSLPVFAEPGTIRGDFSHDAPTSANIEGRVIYNVVHATETVEEAKQEVAFWFNEDEIFDYDRSEHVVMFGDKRHLKA